MSKKQPTRTEPYNRREQAGLFAQLVGMVQSLLAFMFLGFAFLDARTSHKPFEIAPIALVLGAMVLASSVVLVRNGRALERSNNNIKANVFWLVGASALAAASTMKSLGSGVLVYGGVILSVFIAYSDSRKRTDK